MRKHQRRGYARDGGHLAVRVAPGAQEVSIVCLERRVEMPAALEEVEEARARRDRPAHGCGPTGCSGKDGKVVGLEVVQDEVGFDASGRFNPAPVETTAKRPSNATP
jgi:hypothetical protein